MSTKSKRISLIQTDSVLDFWKKMTEEDKVLLCLNDFSLCTVTHSTWNTFYNIHVETIENEKSVIDDNVGFFMIRKDFINRSIEIQLGYITPEYRGKKFYKEARAALINLMFNCYGMNRIFSSCITENKPSMAVNQFQMRHDGTQMESDWHDGKYVDRFTFGLTRRHWEKNQASFLIKGE